MSLAWHPSWFNMYQMKMFSMLEVSPATISPTSSQKLIKWNFYSQDTTKWQALQDEKKCRGSKGMFLSQPLWDGRLWDWRSIRRTIILCIKWIFLKKWCSLKLIRGERTEELQETNEFKSLALFCKTVIALDEDSLAFLSNISQRENSKKVKYKVLLKINFHHQYRTVQ